MSQPSGTASGASGDTSPRWWVRAYVVVPLVASVAAVALAWIDPTRVSLGASRYAGLAGVAGGVGLVAWTVLTYSHVGETLSPVARPNRLVTTGPLAWTRNPMYLGVVTTIAGVAVLGQSSVAGAYATLLALVYHAIVVFVEEPKLEAAFGAEYRSYRESVPRWLPRRR